SARTTNTPCGASPPTPTSKSATSSPAASPTPAPPSTNGASSPSSPTTTTSSTPSSPTSSVAPHLGMGQSRRYSASWGFHPQHPHEGGAPPSTPLCVRA